MCVLFFNEVLYINVWASIIRTFQLSEHIQVPMSLHKRGSAVHVIKIPPVSIKVLIRFYGTLNGVGRRRVAQKIRAILMQQ